MLNFLSKRAPEWAPQRVRFYFFLAFMLLLCANPAGAQNQSIERTWGLGWDDGLTLRRWVAGTWELGLGAGPSDFLKKEESQSWLLTDPLAQQGLSEIPVDSREEHGWARLQIGRLIKSQNNLALVGFSGLTYEWIDYQEKILTLNTLVGDYDTNELDRFTSRWSLSVGLRPSWRPTDFMTIEMAVGLRFVWESWDQKIVQGPAGVQGYDYEKLHGYSRTFEDFGWSGMSSLQFIFWL